MKPLIKKSGRIVRTTIALENEFASFAVGDAEPIATQRPVNSK